jgi:hypothetical protein
MKYLLRLRCLFLKQQHEGDDEREDAEAEVDNKPSRTDRLIEAMMNGQRELIAELRRPKNIKRGADGRAVGVE